MNYNKAGAHLRMLGYQKTSTIHEDEFWTCPDKNMYTHNARTETWDMTPTYVSRPMYKTLNMLNDPRK